MNKQAFLLQSICSVYPDLRIASVEFNGDGQNNDVLVVNDELIFRFQVYECAQTPQDRDGDLDRHPGSRLAADTCSYICEHRGAGGESGIDKYR